MISKEFNANGDVAKFATTIVTIKGESKDIIPAFTKFSIKRKDLPKSKILENLDKGKILPAFFAFTSTKPFRDEDVTLFDYNGVEIPQELDEQVLVYLDDPKTINLFELSEEPLLSVTVECKSVADAYSYVATTCAIAQLPTKDEWIGIGAATTKENVLSQILQFAKDRKMNGTAAQAYFGLSCRIASLQKAAITMVTPFEDIEFRSLEEATRLFQATEKAFGAKCAVQTRYIRALNTSIKINTLDEVIEALNAIDEVTKQTIIDARCEDKRQFIQDFVSKQIGMRRNAA